MHKSHTNSNIIVGNIIVFNYTKLAGNIFLTSKYKNQILLFNCIDFKQYMPTSGSFGCGRILSGVYRWSWLMSLSSCPVKCHDPTMSILLIFCSKQNGSSFADRIKEKFSPFQIWKYLCNTISVSYIKYTYISFCIFYFLEVSGPLQNVTIQTRMLLVYKVFAVILLTTIYDLLKAMSCRYIYK